MGLKEDILIERFLKKELSKTEKNEVLNRMGSDVIFREKVLLEQQLSEALNENDWSLVKNIDNSIIKEYEEVFKSEDILKLKKTISKANNNYKEKKVFNNKKWILYSCIASIALLISLFTFNFSDQNNEELYSSYINKTEIPSIINRGDDNQYKNLAQGQVYFENKEYKKAEEIFYSALNNTKNSSVYLFLAVSQTELNKVEEAEKTLDLLINSDLLDAEKGYWYKALLNLKSNKISKAKSILKTIIDNSYYKTSEAKKLYEKIQNI